MAIAKSLNLLLYGEGVNDVICVQDSNWNSGELYLADRKSIAHLADTDAFNKEGLYLLLSRDQIFIGQSTDLFKKLYDQIVNADWWEKVVILSTKDNNLNQFDIDYLKNILIEKANYSKKSDYKRKIENIQLDKFRIAFLNQYAEEAVFIMQFIGIDIFNENNRFGSGKPYAADVITKLTIGKNAKSDAIVFLKAKNIEVSDVVTYAVRQQDKNYFWANPRPDIVDTDWTIILNNNEKKELIVLEIPVGTFKIAEEKSQNGLIIRKDTNKIDLKIETETFKDRQSGIDFSPYIIAREKYSK